MAAIAERRDDIDTPEDRRMNGRRQGTVTFAVALALVAVGPTACSGPAASSASAAGAATSAPPTRTQVPLTSTATVAVACDQLTVAQVQPFVASPITKEPAQATGNADDLGQTCSFSTDDSDAVDVVVLPDGSLGTSAYDSEVKSEGGQAVAIPGVGEKATRKKGDITVNALSGGVYCSVTAEASVMPGIGDWELAHGGTSDVPESIVTPAAAAVGTLCNRIFGTGNTQPDLAAVAAAVAAAT